MLAVLLGIGLLLFSCVLPYLTCRLTEADLRLYPTIIRYDSAYAILFKCSRRRVSDYPHLQAWLRDMYQLKVPCEGLQVSTPPVHHDCRVPCCKELFAVALPQDVCQHCHREAWAHFKLSSSPDGTVCFPAGIKSWIPHALGPVHLTADM